MLKDEASVLENVSMYVDCVRHSVSTLQVHLLIVIFLGSYVRHETLLA